MIAACHGIAAGVDRADIYGRACTRVTKGEAVVQKKKEKSYED
jgi:hypothetical protein